MALFLASCSCAESGGKLGSRLLGRNDETGVFLARVPFVSFLLIILQNSTFAGLHCGVPMWERSGRHEGISETKPGNAVPKSIFAKKNRPRMF